MGEVGAASRPDWVDSLLRQVEAAFVMTGATTPGWEDPHPDRHALEDEYSRCLDPGKFRILDARVDAWVKVLADRQLAQVTTGPADAWLDGVRDPATWWRVRQLEPTAEGGLMLVLASTLVDREPFGLDVGVGGAGLPTVLMDSVPDCGCDACDSGSADLLQTLDGWLLSVVRGGVVHARSESAHVSRTLDGWRANGRAQPEVWLDASSPTPAGVTRWAGSGWIPHTPIG
jgi:hypothetical protein